MWYGVVFAILVELLPASFRSLGLAISLFIVNNVGGNLPVIVTPLTKAFGFRGALTVLYPGALFISKIYSYSNSFLSMCKFILWIQYNSLFVCHLHQVLFCSL